ncbi:MAG: hypothetical protein EA357_04840 [Micavibrio sp.]|nr:MAG: hypothetical protein EA357_04840 [Micavibrio sp.]
MDTRTMTEQTEHAKKLHEHIAKILRVGDTIDREKAVQTLMLYGGMLSETLFEYEEPDLVMEQSFYRIADLLETEPEQADLDDLLKKLPPMGEIDYFTEKGRGLAREAARQLDKGLDDVHEIVIGLIISDLPEWEKDQEIGMPVPHALRLLMEMVITCAIFETSALEFCDILIDDFISEGWGVDISLASLAALSAVYAMEARAAENGSIALDLEAKQDLHDSLARVMQGEVNRHASGRDSKWTALNPVNDEQDNSHYREMLEELREPIDSFFEHVGFDDPSGRAVAVAKAAGRMVAASTADDGGYMPGPVGQMIVLRGLQASLRYDPDAE